MSYLRTFKKENKAYVFSAVDRDRLRVIDIEVSEDRSFASYLPLAFRLERYNIDYICTDDYEVYSKYKISDSKRQACN